MLFLNVLTVGLTWAGTSAAETFFVRNVGGSRDDPAGLQARTRHADLGPWRDSSADYWLAAVLAPALVPDALANMPLGADSAPAPDSAGSAPVGSPAQAAETEAVIALFIQGYRDSSGYPAWESHFVLEVIPCESHWNTFAVSPAGHLGLAQFEVRSWEKAGGGDWTDPYQQGANVARWSSMTNPATQWSCW